MPRLHFWPRLERYVARRRGYDVLQLTLRDLTLDHAIDLVLDVGANRGQYRDELRDVVGYSGRILSFEPLPQLAGEMVARSRDDAGWDVHAVALGDSDGETDLTISSSDVFTSQLGPSEYGARQFAASIRAVGNVTVPLRRLDTALPDLVPDWSARRILLKTDTQGADRSVLTGAGRILEQVRVLQVELAFQPLYEGVMPAYEMLGWLHDRGFDPCAFFPVAGRDRGRLIEADCVLLNRALL